MKNTVSLDRPPCFFLSSDVGVFCTYAPTGTFMPTGTPKLLVAGAASSRHHFVTGTAGSSKNLVAGATGGSNRLIPGAARGACQNHCRLLVPSCQILQCHVNHPLFIIGTISNDKPIVAGKPIFVKCQYRIIDTPSVSIIFMTCFFDPYYVV